VFLGVLTFACVVLLSARSHLLVDEGGFESVVSRESAFLLNNVVFVVFTFTVLLGTLFPLVNEAISGEQISVGEPYFDKMAVPIGMLLVFLMGVGPMLPWGTPKPGVVLRRFLFPLSTGLLTIGFCWGAGLRGGMTLITFGLCGFATVVTVLEMLAPAFERQKRRGEAFLPALWGSILGGRRRFGGYVIHLGIIVIVVGIGASRSYRETVEASVEPGQTFQLSDYTFRYNETKVIKESNRSIVRAEFDVFHEDTSLGKMTPGLNYYQIQREPIGTPHVKTVGTTDVYLSVLSVSPDGKRVGIKAYVFPFVFLLWLSLPIITLGAMIALWPRARLKGLGSARGEVGGEI
jgi:cytochrome c-type biogenesis protein CcmF